MMPGIHKSSYSGLWTVQIKIMSSKGSCTEVFLVLFHYLFWNIRIPAHHRFPTTQKYHSHLHLCGKAKIWSIVWELNLRIAILCSYSILKWKQNFEILLWSLLCLKVRPCPLSKTEKHMNFESSGKLIVNIVDNKSNPQK